MKWREKTELAIVQERKVKNKMGKEKEHKKILKEFIEQQMAGSRIGSGDDEFYAIQIEDYINKQRELWLAFIKFVLKKTKSKKVRNKNEN